MSHCVYTDVQRVHGKPVILFITMQQLGYRKYLFPFCVPFLFDTTFT